ncbi:MAG TPA: adenylate/guanylate cyclase domain-containing protein [Candidatus Methylacidiphilales bacterium]
MRPVPFRPGFRFRLTLRRVFLLSLAGLVAALGLLFAVILSVTEETLLHSAEQFQRQVSDEAAGAVSRYLDQAPASLALFDQGIARGLVRIGETMSVRDGLFALLLANENLSEASFTYGTDRGFDAEGNRLLAPGSVGEISVFRSKLGGGRIVCRRIRMEQGKLVSAQTVIEPGARVWMPEPDSHAVADPAASLTFLTPADRNHEGVLLSTDLHWSQLDDALPEDQRRVELSFMRSVTGADKRFAGVVRVGLLEGQIENAVLGAVPQLGDGPQPSVFLCDGQGRLVAASFVKDQKIADLDGDLRLKADAAAKAGPVENALSQPVLAEIGDGRRDMALVLLRPGPKFPAQKRVHLCTFRSLPGTQGWIVGVMAPRDNYLGPLIALRHRLLAFSLALIGTIVVLGWIVLRGVGRAHGKIVAEAGRMNAFDFAPTPPRRLLFDDVQQVLSGIERAKTAMRAMGKYVPVDLVRRLYRDGREPVLGGETADLTLLFTDIRDFTSYAEATPPDLLARVLGRYLDAVARAVQDEEGTVDKYIGDAVMAFWNAPEPVRDHPLRACRAALRARAALDALYDGAAWKRENLPRFETRFGLHRSEVSVGHFGAADRFNYTVIGDGVNLASRLEGLNKYYGTVLIASEAVRDAAREAFLFRRLDCVAVKGKEECVTIYELVGERTEGGALPEPLRRYEEALARFERRDFAGALGLLEQNAGDGPSAFLAARCRELIAAPPGADWQPARNFDGK